MSRETTFVCEVCGERFVGKEEQEVLGLRWISSDVFEAGDRDDCNTHVCIKCLACLADVYWDNVKNKEEGAP